jgi:DNA repair exonuclease SbcCD ATPase subunit
MEGFMDQQMALLRQEHEEAIRQLKQQHNKELEGEVDRHREELETALTRAQMCLLSPSLPNNPPTTATPQELEALKREREELLKQRDDLQQKVRLVTCELEESSKSLVAFDDRLSKKDEKIARLKDETKSLYLSLNNITESNQVLKEKARDMKRRMSQEPSVDWLDAGTVARPHGRPLFANPLMARYWDLAFVAVFGVVLVLHHLLTCFWADDPSL